MSATISCFWLIASELNRCQHLDVGFREVFSFGELAKTRRHLAGKLNAELLAEYTGFEQSVVTTPEVQAFPKS